MPPPYRPAASITTGFGAAIIRQGDLRVSSGKKLKASGFGRVLSGFAPQGIHPGCSAPSAVVPAGKLNTTQTMLPPGEALKKRNFVYVLLNSAPILYGTNRSIPLLHFALFNLHFAIFPCRSLLPGRSAGGTLPGACRVPAGGIKTADWRGLRPYSRTTSGRSSRRWAGRRRCWPGG